MKVVVYTNILAFEQPGGAEIYLMNLVKELKRQGAKEGIVFDFYEGVNSIRNYDIAVFHNSAVYSVLAYEYLSLAKKYLLKTINIPVYFSFTTMLKTLEKFLFRLGALLVQKYASKLGAIFRSKIEYFYLSLRLSDAIMVSGNNEKEALNRDFGVSTDRMYILPIAVESRFAYSKPYLFMEKYGIRECILYVGRIERRKNVLSLIKAYRKIQTDIPLVIIGHVNKNEADYYNKIRLYVTNNNLSRKVIIIHGLKHNDPLLESVYSVARVFVLPSYYETPGIAAMEAALAGANIVITKYGTTKEYFGDYALYVEPSDINDIAEKLRTALQRPWPNAVLREHILKNFTYERVARKFLELIWQVIQK